MSKRQLGGGNKARHREWVTHSRSQARAECCKKSYKARTRQREKKESSLQGNNQRDRRRRWAKILKTSDSRTWEWPPFTRWACSLPSILLLAAAQKRHLKKKCRKARMSVMWPSPEDSSSSWQPKALAAFTVFRDLISEPKCCSAPPHCWPLSYLGAASSTAWLLAGRREARNGLRSLGVQRDFFWEGTYGISQSASILKTANRGHIIHATLQSLGIKC